MINLAIEEQMAEEIIIVLDGIIDCMSKCNNCFNPKRVTEMVEILIDLLKEGE